MGVPWKYLLLCFALTWVVWVPGVLLHADVTILTFGSAGPSLAAIWVARRCDRLTAQPLRRLVFGGVVWLVCWVIFEVCPPGSAGWRWPIHWNPRSIALAILPAWILSGALSSDRGICELLRTMWIPQDWRWPLISFFAIPAYLLIPAAGARVIGLLLVAPPHPDGWLSLAVFGTASFARNLLFTSVFEEPGWRGTLLHHLQARRSPLTASLFVWFPWMLWHAPLDLTGGSAHTFTGWLQIRAVFLIPMAILLTWIYNRSGRSLFCTSLFHAALNTFPFVLPWSPPMLGLVFVWAIGAVIHGRMWRGDTVTPAPIPAGVAT